VSMRCRSGRPSGVAPLGSDRRSAPEENARPAPASSTARTSSSCAAASSDGRRSLPSCSSQAFSASGRLSSILATPPARATFTVSSSRTSSKVVIGGSYAWTVSRPVIGICASVESARWSVWDAEAVLTPRGYVDAVQRAGGMAVLLVPDPRADEDPDEVLDLVDGLILAGGSDIDPSAYGHERHPETKGTHPDRDRFELTLAARAMERDLPLLGICRG